MHAVHVSLITFALMAASMIAAPALRAQGEAAERQEVKKSEVPVPMDSNGLPNIAGWVKKVTSTNPPGYISSVFGRLLFVDSWKDRLPKLMKFNVKAFNS